MDNHSSEVLDITDYKVQFNNITGKLEIADSNGDWHNITSDELNKELLDKIK